MTTTSSSDLGRSAVGGIRTALGVTGVIALIVGILVLVWPGQAIEVVTAIVAIYAIVGGLVYAGVGIFSKTLGGWARVGHIILGILFVAAGIIVFANLGFSADVLAVWVAILIGILWIVDGIVSLTLIGDSSSKTWTIIYAIISIIAGIVLVTSPIWGALVLVWLLGISLIVLGLVQVIRAFTFGKGV